MCVYGLPLLFTLSTGNLFTMWVANAEVKHTEAPLNTNIKTSPPPWASKLLAVVSPVNILQNVEMWVTEWRWKTAGSLCKWLFYCSCGALTMFTIQQKKKKKSHYWFTYVRYKWNNNDEWMNEWKNFSKGEKFVCNYHC